MKFEDLSPELQEKAKACKTPEEIIALAKESGYELADEDLEALAGGKGWGPSCGSECYTDGCYTLAASANPR